MHDYLVVNCSNVRPHTYMLNAIANIWGKEQPAYTQIYFPHCSERVQRLYDGYFRALPAYGEHEDEHGGDQYYHYTMRAVCHGWLTGRFGQPERDLVWLTGDKSLTEQVKWLEEKADESLPGLQKYYEECVFLARELDGESDPARQLFSDSVLLQAVIHYKSLLAEKSLCEAYRDSLDGKQEEAFMKLGRSTELLDEALDAMKAADHDKWEGFYDNDCLTDVKFTSYLLWHVMGYVRNLGDGPHFYRWALKYGDAGSNHGVVLLTNLRNHLKDQEMYLLMKDYEAKCGQQRS